jgi:hypothetical protein
LEAVRLDLAYARAKSYTHYKAAPGAEAAPLDWLENAKAGARERLVGSPVCGGLPIRKAWCFAYQVFALYKDFPDTGCLYSKSPDRNTSSAFEVSAAASEPFF